MVSSLLTQARHLWNRYWRAILIAAAVLVVFIWGAALGQWLAPRQVTPTPTAAPVPPPGATLILEGVIVDVGTGRPVIADVYVDDQRVREGVTRIDLTVQLTADRLTEIRIEAPGYYTWGIAAKGGDKAERIDGPFHLIPIEPTVPEA